MLGTAVQLEAWNVTNTMKQSETWDLFSVCQVIMK